MNLTYQQLLDRLKKLSKEELNQNVSIAMDNSEEVLPVKKVDLSMKGDWTDDILDRNHVVLRVDF